MDYTKIVADEIRGPEIGKMYIDASPYITTLARIAYREFAQEVTQQFRSLPVEVIALDHDPYPNAEAMFRSIERGRLHIYRTTDDQSHPLLTRQENNQFRAVHDYHGHYLTGRDFSRHGEEAAWVRHSQMFAGLAKRAMTTETRGQSSAFIWINGGREFPVQKAVLLPDWVSVVPERWL